jgi:hypothetical protein
MVTLHYCSGDEWSKGKTYQAKGLIFETNQIQHQLFCMLPILSLRTKSNLCVIEKCQIPTIVWIPSASHNHHHWHPIIGGKMVIPHMGVSIRNVDTYILLCQASRNQNGQWPDLEASATTELQGRLDWFISGQITKNRNMNFNLEYGIPPLCIPHWP